MRRIIAFLTVFMYVSVPIVLAQQMNDLDSYEQALKGDTKSDVKSDAKSMQTAGQDSDATLVDVTDSRQFAQLSSLERRISALERDDRFQDERLRQLERSIDDLKRRR